MKFINRCYIIIAALISLSIPWVTISISIINENLNIKINKNSRNLSKKMNITNLTGANKKLATYLVDMYHNTKNAENEFLLHFENTQKMFNEIKKENIKNPSSTTSYNSNINTNINKNININTNTNTTSEKVLLPVSNLSPRFVQLKAKGPVEEETIWRAIYDTQLRRSPPSATVNVYSEEDIGKEYEEAKLDSYASEINRLKKQFEINLKYMSEELVRQKQIKETVKKVLLLEEEIKKLEQTNKNKNKNGPIKTTKRIEESTKVKC